LIHEEISQMLFTISGHAFSARIIRNCMKRKNTVYRLINEHRPIEQDRELFRFWRQEVIYEGGPFTARMLLYIDEMTKKVRDMWRRRAHRPVGGRVIVPAMLRGSRTSGTVIAALSIRGMAAGRAVETREDGTVGKRCI